HAFARAPRRLGLGQSRSCAQVCDLCAACIVDEDIGRLQVTMHDAFGVNVREPVADVDREPDDLFEEAIWIGITESIEEGVKVFPGLRRPDPFKDKEPSALMFAGV